MADVCIDVGIHNCPGYTSTGGPWIKPDLAMQQIFHSRVDVAGDLDSRSAKGFSHPKLLGCRLCAKPYFPLINQVVGLAGFEPTTPCPPGKCATRLRYSPLRERAAKQTGEMRVGKHVKS